MKISKPKIKYCGVFMALFFYSSVFSQFNTLTQKAVKKEEPFPKTEGIQKTENDKQKKPENKRKLFGPTTKAELKREIDSLKRVMLQLSLEKNEERKLNFRKIEDSMIKIMKANIETIKNPRESAQKWEKSPFGSLEADVFMPLKNGMTVTSPFGIRIHPIFGISKMHNGVDFKASYENVYAVLDGVVTEAGWDFKGGGNYIKIRHSDSFVTSYLHLSKMYYKAGEFVKAGFIIAKSGNSGNSTGAHLHFSVTENGKHINPVRFLNDLIKVNHLIATYYAK